MRSALWVVRVQGSAVEAMHGEFAIDSGDEFEDHLLRKEMVDQPVYVLIGAASKE